MDLTRWNRIEELLQKALDLEPQARPEFLRGECGGDEELRRELDSLLRRDAEGLPVTDRPAIAWVAAEMAGDAPRLRAGEKLGRYRIETRIGAGGMGEVYEARDETLRRTVAIKVLPAEVGADADRVRRFEQEALAASKLNHPNIVTIFEFVHLDGVHFIVAECVEGETLRSLLIDAQTNAPRKLELRQALDIAVQTATALNAAHAASIVHRDIKPENIMVRSDGLVKVLDFGIAKVTGASDLRPFPACDPLSDMTLTVPGAVLGTASYMSPEQMRGEPLDERTDLFSLGVVLYEMLSGERPFTGTARAETSTVRLDQALPSTNRLGQFPYELQRIVRKMLEPEREARYRSATAVLDDLRALQRHLDGRRMRTVTRVSVGAALLMLVLGAVGTWLSFSEVWQERVLRDGHTAAVRQVVFSPDGRVLISCSEDGQVIVWDFARRQRLQTLKLLAHKLAFSPDGRWFATGGHDGAVIIWDAERRIPLRRLGGHPTEIGALTISPDGSMLAAANYDSAAVWRTRDWRKLYEWNNGGYGSFVFSRDVRHLLFGADHGLIHDLTGRRQLPKDSQPGANWMIVSPDGARLAALDSAGNLSFYRLATPGKLEQHELIARVRAHRDHGRSLAFSPDGRILASAAEDILLWDVATHAKMARFEYPAIVWSVAFSPDGRWLVSSHADGAVLVWDVAERERVFSFNDHSAAVRTVAFSPDGRTVASGAEDRTITLWDPKLGRKLAVLTPHATRLSGVTFARQSGRFASADYDGNVIVWDATGRPQARFRSEPVALCLAISPDGRFVATTRGVYAANGRMLLDFEETTLTFDHYAHPFVYGVSFSADGRKLAAVSEGGVVMIWDARTLRLLELQHVPNTSQISVSLSADGERMITGEDEGTVRLWSVTPLRQEAILGRHTARVKSVAFAPDGRTAASAGDDKTIALWDVNLRRLRTRIGTHTSPVYSIAFSSDGRQLLSGEHDRSVRLYTRHRTVWGMEWD